MGYSPWGCKESGTTKRLILTHSLFAIIHFEKSQNNIKVTNCFKNYNKGISSAKKNNALLKVVLKYLVL